MTDQPIENHSSDNPHRIGISLPQARLMYIHRVMLVTALVGLFASIYLFITYVAGSPIVCGLLHGCEVVRASQWAYLQVSIGGFQKSIPRPLLGIIFYFGVIALLTFRAYAPHYRPRWWRLVLLLATTIGIVESGYLMYVQWHDIGAFCTWCVTSAIAATILFFLSLFDGREAMAKGTIIKELRFIFVIFATAIVAGTIALHFLLANEAGGNVPKATISPTTSINSQAEAEAALLPTYIPVEGPATSTVTIVEFMDFECPSCGVFQPTMVKIRKEYAGRIRYAQRMFPLVELHPYAHGAAIAAECALKQNDYFDYSDALMANQAHLTHDDFIRYASALHLDTKAFDACLSDPSVSNFVDAERKAGDALGINATPTFFINGEEAVGAIPYDELKATIDAKLKS